MRDQASEQGQIGKRLGDLDVKQMQRVTEAYKQRHSVLTLVRLLNHLVSAIQKHRGVSLAQLAGDGLFNDDVSTVQREINKRLWVMQHSCDHFHELVPENVQINLQQSWATVHQNWEGDEILENFEYHSFLIDQLFQLSTGLTRQLAEPLALSCNLPEGAMPRTNSPMNQWILSLVSRGIPQLIEHLAKIRGIATHSAVVGGCEAEEEKKLRYWIQCAEQENQALMNQIDTMEKSVRDHWHSLGELKGFEFKLAFFLNTVSRDIIHGDCKRTEARTLFSLGSDLIGAYVEAVDGGITLMQSALESELEAWLQSEA